MAVPKCDHPDKPAAHPICSHILDLLREREELDIEYGVWFDGRNAEPHFVCYECRTKLLDEEEIPLKLACEDCFNRVETEGFAEFVIGDPVITVRPSSLRFVHENVDLDQPLTEVVEACPTSAGVWLLLSNSGEIRRLELASYSITSIGRLPDMLLQEVDSTSVFPEHVKKLPPKLHMQVSQDEALVLVVNDHSQFGVVLDADTGKVLPHLNRRGDYLEYTRFPAAFATIQGRTLLVHGTEWNRLDVTDPRTGELLTSREPTTYKRGEKRPDHYLDYFHARLYVSPDQAWIMDWGWVWHPLGVISAWSLEEWLNNNVWESEDGPTKQNFCQREYNWDEPACWLDNRTICVWGHSNDDLGLYPSVTMYNVTNGEQVNWFTGPPRAPLVYDDYLFCMSEEQGTSVWDIATGDCLLVDPELRPIGYDRKARQFLSIRPDGTAILSRLNAG